MLLVIPVLFGVSIAAFLMSHLVPGDPVAVMLGEQATAEDAARLREALGLNDPLYVQYFRYVSDALQGDLGTSIRSGQPVLEEILDRFPSTLILTDVRDGDGRRWSVWRSVSLAAVSKRPGGRCRHHGIRPDRHFDADLLVRHPADPLLRAQARLAADRRDGAGKP